MRHFLSEDSQNNNTVESLAALYEAVMGGHAVEMSVIGNPIDSVDDYIDYIHRTIDRSETGLTDISPLELSIEGDHIGQMDPYESRFIEMVSKADGTDVHVNSAEEIMKLGYSDIVANSIMEIFAELQTKAADIDTWMDEKQQSASAPKPSPEELRGVRKGIDY